MMRWTGLPRRRYPLVAAALVCAAASTSSGHSALAEDSSFCVTCRGPDNTYLCQATHARGMSKSIVKYACIVQLAKTGEHESCAVSHERSDSCRGELRQVNLTDLPGTFGGPPAQSSADESPAPSPRAEQPLQDQSLGERPSVARMTKRAIRASRNGVANVVENRPVRAAAQKTGSRFGRMARCARKFFWKCGESDANQADIEPLPAPE